MISLDAIFLVGGMIEGFSYFKIILKAGNVIVSFDTRRIIQIFSLAHLNYISSTPCRRLPKPDHQ